MRLEPGERQWAVLTAAPVNLALDDPQRRVQMAQLGSDLPASAIASYQPIDWHRDLRSGFAWDPRQFYLDVRVAPIAGADIKFPRELSRFQHVGALARAAGDGAALEFLLQVLDWIAANPPRRGVNWACTMDVALRAVNWIWGLRLFEREVTRYPAALRLVARSLREHGRHIEDNLEYYEECTSNHYLSNVAGLVYVGAAYPDFPESDRWLMFGLQELVSEMDREVYSEGADYEASTHYHRLVAELFASCSALAERIPPARRARLAQVDVRAHRVRPRLRPAIDSGLNLNAVGPVLPAQFYARLARMAEFTAALTKPNGLVPQFGDNDSARIHKLLPRADADVRDHRHLLALVGELLDRGDLRTQGAAAAAEAKLIAGGLRGIVAPPPATVDFGGAVTFFPVSGVAVMRRGAAYLAITCGPNGQGGRGGHGHNDKNSFELNVGGVDFVVDGGCPVYSSAPEIRNRYRSTAAHSTVSVAGEEQDRWSPGVNGLFRLPERCAPRLETVDGTVTGRHSGFGPTHQRRFRLEPGRLVIDDQLDDPRPRSVNFNLAPEVTVQALKADDSEVRCELVHARGPRLRLTLTGLTEPELGPGSFSVGYGVPVDNLKLSARMLGAAARTVISWEA